MTITLTRMQRDTLKEVTSIGANSASTALSKLTNRQIMVQLTKLEVFPIEEIPQRYKGEKNIGVLFGIYGDMGGAMLSLASEETVCLLCDMIQGKELGSKKSLDAYGQDLIKEVGNILVGSYLAALSTMSELNMLETVPELLVDTTSKLLGEASKYLKGSPRDVVVIENVLIIEKQKFKQELILILMPQQLDKLFKILFKKLE